MEVIRNASARLLGDLLNYADRFKEITGISDTGIGREAVRDPSFLNDIRSGKRKLTIEKYDELVAYFDRTLADRKD